MISTTPSEEHVEPLKYTILSNAKATPIDWLWRPYIPKGGLSLLMGDGGYGKSFLTCALAADLSAGRPLPGQSAMRPQKILMISGEDGIGPVIIPRMQSLDAQMENIAVFDEGFALNPKMTKKILATVEDFDAAVVFIDPMVVYMGGGIDSHKANEVRSLLDPLTTIAKKKNFAVVCVHHVNKGGATGQHKALGSVDYINGVRSSMLVDHSKNGTYFMSHVKSNWAQKGPTLAYAFSGDSFRWLGAYEPSTGEDGVYEVSHTPRGKAKAFLLAILADGPVPMLEVAKRAKDEGLSENTLQKAKRGVCHSIRQKDTTWAWELDESAIKSVAQGGAKAQSGLDALAATTPAQGTNVEARAPETDDERVLREALDAVSKRRV